METDSIDTTCRRKTPKEEQEKGEVPNRDNQGSEFLSVCLCHPLATPGPEPSPKLSCGNHPKMEAHLGNDLSRTSPSP